MTARKKRPLTPKSSMDQRDVKRLQERWTWLTSRLGGQKALADALTNPKTGKPVNPRTLRKWWSGERALPNYAADDINDLFTTYKKEDALERRRHARRIKLDKILSKISVHTFSDWFTVFENEMWRDYGDVDNLENVLETLLTNMTDLDPETVLIYQNLMPAWISSTYGRHVISQICRSDLILIGYRIFVNGKYTRIYPIEHRPSRPMWNHQNTVYTRTEQIPKLFDLILDAWQTLTASEYGDAVLVAFAQDPEQID